MSPPSRRSAPAPQPREDVFSVICHDLKDPLAAIVMGTNLLLKTVPEREDRTRRVLEAVSRAATRLDEVIRRCHDLTRLEQGRLELETKPHRLDDVLEAAAARLELVASRRNVRVEKEIRVSGERLVCDVDRVVEVVEHLGDNATRYTRSGSIAFGAEVEGHQVMVFVRDEGAGIPQQELDAIFDWRRNAARPTRDGTGLGLALVQGIVQAHGGKVTAESTPGKGSTFRFSLPLGTRTAPHHAHNSR